MNTAEATPDVPTIDQMARDVLSLAQRGGMPASYWATDSRVARACTVLGLTPAQASARDWTTRPAGPAAPAQPAQPVEPAGGSAADVAEVHVWTDGACSGNPGPGGWGWVTPDGRQGYGGDLVTTNQRMEIRAAFEAVSSISQRPLVVFSDSRYVVDCFNKSWWKGWLARGWKNTAGKPVANRDLWEPFIDLVVFGGVTAVQDPARQPVIDRGVAFRWVKGHAGDPMNEAADALAVAAREAIRRDHPRRLLT